MKYLLLAAVFATVACSTPAEPTSPVAPLANTFDSPEALAGGVLAALANRDLARLTSLALTEAEFKAHVWPELPVSRPERNVPFDYAWGQMKQHSDGSLSGTLARYGGRRLRLVRTQFAGETTAYKTFSVMRDSQIVAVDESGREVILRLYGSAMVKEDRYKLYSYVVD